MASSMGFCESRKLGDIHTMSGPRVRHYNSIDGFQNITRYGSSNSGSSDRSPRSAPRWRARHSVLARQRSDGVDFSRNGDVRNHRGKRSDVYSGSDDAGRLLRAVVNYDDSIGEDSD